MQASIDPRLKALNACYLTMVESKRGNTSAAERMLALVRRLDPDCMLLEKANAVVKAAFD